MLRPTLLALTLIVTPLAASAEEDPLAREITQLRDIIQRGDRRSATLNGCLLTFHRWHAPDGGAEILWGQATVDLRFADFAVPTAMKSAQKMKDDTPEEAEAPDIIRPGTNVAHLENRENPDEVKGLVSIVIPEGFGSVEREIHRDRRRVAKQIRNGTALFSPRGDGATYVITQSPSITLFDSNPNGAETLRKLEARVTEYQETYCRLAS